MIAMRIAAFLWLAAITVIQGTSVSKQAKSDMAEPKLPVIDYNACPGKDRVVPHVKIVQDDQMYSSWQDARELVATLKAKEELTVLAGVNVIREPDRALLKKTDSSLSPSLKPGDVVLRYGLHADGESDFWAKGVWFKVNFEDTEEKGSFCGFGKDQCTVLITKNGVSEWWVQVKIASGQTGWVLASKSTGDKRSASANFRDVCGLD